MRIELIKCTDSPIKTIAAIASVCYDSNPKDALKLVTHLYKSGHHSVLEHVYLTFEIDGISRACLAQLTRHRLASYTVRSQRYCKETDFDFVVPTTLDGEIFRNQVKFLQKWYNSYVDSGVSAEDARYILPNACATKLVMSVNLRELIHIAEERLCKRAQWEIRELVTRMIEVVPAELRFMLKPKCGRTCHEC